MAEAKRATGARARGARRRKPKIVRATTGGDNATIEGARRAGLLDSEGSEHLSFRAPKALVEAAKRETGIESPTELGILALAALAQPDPVVAFLKRTRGRLGEDAGLDY